MEDISVTFSGYVCLFIEVTSQQTRLANTGLMLARRLRRRPSINPALGKYIIFAGITDHTLCPIHPHLSIPQIITTV